MRWEDGEQKGNVEDRRGKAMPLAAGGGLMGLIIMGILFYLTGDLGKAKRLADGIAPMVLPKAAPAGGAGAPANPNDANLKFAEAVMGLTDEAWETVFSRLGDQARLIEQFIALQHPLLVPAVIGRQGEQGAGAGQAMLVAICPGVQAFRDSRIVTAAPVFPGKELEHGVPAGVMGLAFRGVGRQGQIADGDLSVTARAGRRAGRGAARVAEGVELFDKAEPKPGLGGYEVPQGAFEGAVTHGIERSEGQGARTVLGRGRQDDGLSVFQGHHDRRQTDANAVLRPLGHRVIPCARRRRRGSGRQRQPGRGSVPDSGPGRPARVEVRLSGCIPRADCRRSPAIPFL